MIIKGKECRKVLPPTPKMVLVPWELTDVPMCALVRDGCRPECVGRIIGKGTVTMNGGHDDWAGLPAVIFDKPLTFHGIYFYLDNLVTYIGKMEYSTDGGISWALCGKMVPAK